MAEECGDNDSFSGIATVDVGRCHLVIHFLRMHEIFECVETFIIEFLKLWFEAWVNRFVCNKDDDGSTPGHGYCENGIAVIAVEDHQVFVAVAGW